MHITVIASQINRHALGTLDASHELMRAGRDGRAAPVSLVRLRDSAMALLALADQYEATPVVAESAARRAVQETEQCRQEAENIGAPWPPFMWSVAII